MVQGEKIGGTSGEAEEDLSRNESAQKVVLYQTSKTTFWSL